MNRLYRKSIALLAGIAVCLVAVGSLVSCGRDGDTAGLTTLERIRQQGVVRIGYANEAPYAYVDTQTGRLTGEAPEIARVILADMGVQEVQGVLTEFGALIPGLQAGRFDLIAAGMYIIPQRCEQVAFSNPTYAIGEALAVPAGNPMELHSYDDVREKGATLGVVTGAIQLDYAREMGIPNDQIVRFPDAPSAIAGVRAGRVDAYGGTALTVQDLVDKSPPGQVERADPFTDIVIDGELKRGYGAFAFRHRDPELVAEFNRRLAEFIGTEEHLDLVREFGFTDSELPGDVTAEELCAR